MKESFISYFSRPSCFYTLAVIGQLSKAKSKIFYFPRYYCAMMLAQILGGYKELREVQRPLGRRLKQLGSYES